MRSACLPHSISVLVQHPATACLRGDPPPQQFQLLMMAIWAEASSLCDGQQDATVLLRVKQLYRRLDWARCSVALCYNRKVVGSISDEVTGVFNAPYPSGRTMALGFTQALTETSTRNPPPGKGRLVRKADNLTATCEPTVHRMWEPRRLTAL
jgi:hypothetical protein